MLTLKPLKTHSMRVLQMTAQVTKMRTVIPDMSRLSPRTKPVQKARRNHSAAQSAERLSPWKVKWRVMFAQIRTKLLPKVPVTQRTRFADSTLPKNANLAKVEKINMANANFYTLQSAKKRVARTGKCAKICTQLPLVNSIWKANAPEKPAFSSTHQS